MYNFLSFVHILKCDIKKLKRERKEKREGVKEEGREREMERGREREIGTSWTGQFCLTISDLVSRASFSTEVKTSTFPLMYFSVFENFKLLLILKDYQNNISYSLKGREKHRQIPQILFSWCYRFLNLWMKE